jgi:rod shape-determining protein MreC
VYRKTVRRRRAVLALLVTISVVLLSAYLGSSSGGVLGRIQAGFLDIFAPIQEGVSTLLTPVRDAISGIDDIVNATSQRNEYRAENRRLLAANAALQADRRHYLQLRGMFTIDHELGVSSHQQVTAQVVSESPSVWYSHVMIDAGSSAGIHVGDVVLDGDGLVGSVSTVTGDAAEVTLLTDPSSGVAARDATTGAWGIVEPAAGSTSRLMLDFPSSFQLAPGDLIVTAGTTANGHSAYPPDIPIGRVTSVDKASSTVSIEPNADVRQLENVQVLTDLRSPAHVASTSSPRGRS